MLNDEEVSEVTIAIALLTRGVVHHYADGPAEADELTNAIRKLEDRFLAKTFDVGDLKLR